MLDVLIRDGLIVDGTGAPARPGAVGIRDGRIVAVGEVDEPARRTIDGGRQGDRARLRGRAHALRRAGVLRHDPEPVARFTA